MNVLTPRDGVKRHLPLLLTLALLLAVYLPTLQTIPNGSDHYYMIDVGETQIVLNVWGTLHATGYPLYVMLSAALVSLLRLAGVSAAAAPAVTSLIWGLLALAGVYTLARRLLLRDERSAPWIAAGAVLLFGMTRTVWLHSAIAEIYTLTLLLLVGLLHLALSAVEAQTDAQRERALYGLALLGGIAVLHHRVLLFCAPALLLAAWRGLLPLRAAPRRLLICLLLGSAGLLPYLYLPVRAAMTDGTPLAAWVYGDPGTWDGFLDQFLGREGQRFVTLPPSGAALAANLGVISAALLDDVTAVGLGVGLLGLAVGLAQRATRRFAAVLLALALTAFGVHAALWYTDPMPAFTLQTTLPLALGGVLLWRAALVIRYAAPGRVRGLLTALPVLAGALLLFAALHLWGAGQPFIPALTQNRAGLDLIATARGAPPDAALLIEWGPRYFAAAFAQTVTGELREVTVIDDKADLRAFTRLVTPAFTFYRTPPERWAERLGGPLYLSAPAPGLVELARTPRTDAVSTEGITPLDARVTCEGGIALWLTWFTPSVPDDDLSVYVHLRDGDALTGQGDVSAPVYGWRPTSTWTARELIADVYPITPADARGTRIVYGLYRVLPDGTGGTTFENVSAFEIAVPCGG